MDNNLRAAERRHDKERTKESEKALNTARRRAGWREKYVPCKRCSSGTRYVKNGSFGYLCPLCCGDGWTDIVWVPPSDWQKGDRLDWKAQDQ